MESNRVKGWDLRLVDAMTLELPKQFEWGTANCGHLMVASIRACRGNDHPAIKELKPSLTTKAKVVAHVTKRGGLVAILERYFQPLPSVLQARDGDVGVIEKDGVAAGGVVLDGMFVARSEEKPGGLRVPVRYMTKGFRV